MWLHPQLQVIPKKYKKYVPMQTFVGFAPFRAKLLPEKIPLRYVSFCLNPINYIASLAQLER
jgi:hypothetical protein